MFKPSERKILNGEELKDLISKFGILDSHIAWYFQQRAKVMTVAQKIAYLRANDTMDKIVGVEPPTEILTEIVTNWTPLICLIHKKYFSKKVIVEPGNTVPILMTLNQIEKIDLSVVCGSTPVVTIDQKDDTTTSFQVINNLAVLTEAAKQVVQGFTT